MHAEIETVHESDTALVAAERILDSGFASLPVVDGEGRLMGVVSEADLMRLWLPRSVQTMADVSFLPPEADFIDNEGREHLSTIPVAQIMHRKPLYTVGTETSLAEAALLMLRHHIRRLPVIEDGRVVGVINRSDIVRAMLRSVEASPD